MKIFFTILFLLYISHPAFAISSNQTRYRPSHAVLQININQANLSTLQHLKGVGQKRAQALIDYRNQHQGFKNIEEIKVIKGFSKHLFSKIKRRITV